jgi:hypothetical protein
VTSATDSAVRVFPAYPCQFGTAFRERRFCHLFLGCHEVGPLGPCLWILVGLLHRPLDIGGSVLATKLHALVRLEESDPGNVPASTVVRICDRCRSDTTASRRDRIHRRTAEIGYSQHFSNFWLYVSLIVVLGRLSSLHILGLGIDGILTYIV